MLTNEKLSTIPLRNLLAAGALVAVWCTNSPSNIKDLKELLFPAWGLEFVASWFWVKVDRSGSPVGFLCFNLYQICLIIWYLLGLSVFKAARQAAL